VRPAKPKPTRIYSVPVFCPKPLRPNTAPSQQQARDPPPESPVAAPVPFQSPPASYRESQRAIVKDDDLGKIIIQHCAVLLRYGWREFLRTIRGRGDLQIDEAALRGHPATKFLVRLGQVGAPAVMSTAPWSEATLDERVARGSHQSCQDNMEFLREEFLDFVTRNFWTVLPYRTVKELLKDRLSELKYL